MCYRILLSDCTKLSTYFLLKRALHRISTVAESALCGEANVLKNTKTGRRSVYNLAASLLYVHALLVNLVTEFEANSMNCRYTEWGDAHA